MTFPAIAGAVVGNMTVFAKPHIQRLYFMGNRHVFHLTMTEGANFFHVFNREIPVEHKALQMFLVSEVYKIRYVVDFLPGWRRFIGPVLGQLLNTWFVRCDLLVTTHALTGWRNTGDLTATRIGMAVHAVDAVILDMNVVRELDRLFHVFTIMGSNWRHWIC